MIKVIVESPFAASYPAQQELHINYARHCMKDCLDRGEAPFASHLLYTQCLDDDMPEHRRLGIDAGLVWGVCADKTVVYTDLGVTPGMENGIEHAKAHGRPVVYRGNECIQYRSAPRWQND